MGNSLEVIQLSPTDDRYEEDDDDDGSKNTQTFEFL